MAEHREQVEAWFTRVNLNCIVPITFGKHVVRTVSKGRVPMPGTFTDEIAS